MLKIGVCTGRHPLPVDGYVFPQELSPEEIKSPELLLENALSRLMDLGVERYTEIQIYATGLTVAVLAVINAARKIGLKIAVYHYDRDTDSYYPQELL